MIFEQKLREKKLKVTPQRIAILQEIKKGGHIGIEEIYENIKTRYPSISLATVYKNITSLYEANLLREIKIPQHKQKYELACEHHIHVVCQKCGKLEDVFLDSKNIVNLCREATHYELINANVMLIGICSHCK